MSTAEQEQPGGAYLLDSHPCDLELVQCHLRPWAATGRKAAASSFVHEADLYAAGPAELAAAFAPAVALDGQRAWYFLTRLRLKSQRGSAGRIARTLDTGAGCWHGEARERPVVDVVGGGRQVARRQSFSFTREAAGRGRTGWIMSELRLVPDDGREREEGIRVLCKLYRSPRHRAAKPGDGSEPAAAAAAEEEAEDDGQSSATTTTTTAAAPGRNEKSAPVAARDKTSAAPRKRKAAAVADDDDEGSAGASRKRAADGNRPAATGLRCPKCGFHIDAAQQADVGQPKNDSEAETSAQGDADEAGDSSERDHTFYTFL